MPTLLLIRHGRTAANTSGVLAGRTPGVALDEVGLTQVRSLAARLASLPLVAAWTSPLERCVSTAEAVLAGQQAGQGDGLQPQREPRLSECDYGDWTGRSISDLTKDPLWPAVQAHPSSVTFPGGESMRGMQARALEAVRTADAAVAAEHGPHALWAAFSHGDVIKAILADALGMHLDAFQRLVVDPASVSVIRYTPLRPFAVRVNDTGGDVTALMPPDPPAPGEAAADDAAPGAPVSSDAVVGGGAGGAAVVARR